MALATTASAGLLQQYQVSSTSVVNCSDAPHGLWTNDYILDPGGSCANYYDISGTFSIFDDGSGPTAHLDAIATNPGPGSTTALIDMWFGDYATTGDWKQETSNPEPGDAEYFDSITAGSTIKFVEDDGDEYLFDVFELVSPYSLQIGTGGNNKDPSEFGASAWFMAGMSDGDFVAWRDKHWDLNLTFEVPLPATLPLLLVGLAGLFLGTRRRVQG
ncbi:MAG: hypothetical protein U5K33_08775 [Halofilum sp. (in: g-proteobacteria)]|nr:hypothetical protein [Halofilum sp. (in: g-proteobacteria)]